MKIKLLQILLLSMLVFSFSDAKGKGGGIKVRPKGPSIPRPTVPVIVPVLVPVGGFPSHGSYNRNNGRRAQCYSCEGSNNDLCVVNPAAKQKITCPQNQYCSIIRKEILEAGKKTNTTHNSTVMTSTVEPVSFTNMTSTKSPDEIALSSSTASPDALSSSTQHSVIDTSSTTPSVIVSPLSDDANSTSNVRNTRETTRISIERGCKSGDFFEGILLSASKSNGNESEKMFAQLCSTDLCNTGDGRLRCYECQGTGLNHACMNKPSNVSKEVICQPNESCYVERKKVMFNSTSTNSTNIKYMISRGCRGSSLSDDSNVIRTDNVLGFSCRLSDFCNSFDVKRLLSSNSATANSATFGTLVLVIATTLSLQN